MDRKSLFVILTAVLCAFVIAGSGMAMAADKQPTDKELKSLVHTHRFALVIQPVSDTCMKSFPCQHSWDCHIVKILKGSTKDEVKSIRVEGAYEMHENASIHGTGGKFGQYIMFVHSEGMRKGFVRDFKSQYRTKTRKYWNYGVILPYSDDLQKRITDLIGPKPKKEKKEKKVKEAIKAEKSTKECKKECCTEKGCRPDCAKMCGKECDKNCMKDCMKKHKMMMKMEKKAKRDNAAKECKKECCTEKGCRPDCAKMCGKVCDKECMKKCMKHCKNKCMKTDDKTAVKEKKVCK